QIIQSRVSVLYDVLNNISIDAVMSDYSIGEITIFKDNHLKKVKEDDLIIFDRGYPSYDMFATIVNNYNANYLIRAKKNTYQDKYYKEFKNNFKKLPKQQVIKYNLCYNTV
ncbi:MAG: transposase, partial [Arcobacter sp.]|nr:transposase [Arcobacter sp.]